MDIQRRLDDAGREYVLLCLSMDKHDPGYVDAYFGDPFLREMLDPWPLQEIWNRADALLQTLNSIDCKEYRDDSRRDFLVEQTEALRDFSLILMGKVMDFDSECRVLCGVTPLKSHIQSTRSLSKELDRLLPGEGSLNERYQRYMDSFRVPPEQALQIVHRLLRLARGRSSQRLPLPPDDFEVQLVQSAPWEAYNYYLGDAHSRIDINGGVPIGVERTILYAAHEAYPGHHSMWVLREKGLLKDRGWQEHCLLALRSPLALVAEGAAQYGVELVFPADYRRTLYEESLFPELGLPSSEAERYERISSIGTDLMLRHWVDVTRDFLDGQVDEGSTVLRMQEEQLMPKETAITYLEMMRCYRSYVVNYSYGFDLVESFVGETDVDWERYRQVLMEPVTVRGLMGRSSIFQ